MGHYTKSFYETVRRMRDCDDEVLFCIKTGHAEECGDREGTIRNNCQTFYILYQRQEIYATALNI